MNLRMRSFTSLLATTIVSLLALSPPTLIVDAARPQTCGTHCGTERWAVKTLTDQDAGKVNFAPVEKTVAELTSLSAPNQSSENSRLDANEEQTFKVRARLVGFKLETDQDFHIVIADLQDSSKTMVVEIPDPKCDGVCASPKLSEIQKVRQKFVAPFPNAPPGANFLVVQNNVGVTVTGVGFFDFAHGQVGLAKNCIELHPVLDVSFAGSGPFDAKVNHQAQPPKHPVNWYHCIPRGSTPHTGRTHRTRRSGTGH